MSSGWGEGVVACLVECCEHLPGDVAFEAADDLLFGLALLEPPCHVVLGGLMPAQPDQDDPVQRGVGLAVAAAVEAVAGGLARGRLDRRGAAQHREAGVAAQPVGVVAGRPRSCSRSSAGAVTSSACSALVAWVRARMAVARATRSERIISTWPVPALGVTVTWPAWTARAAASASTGSDLPRRRRAWRSGRLTSTTAWPLAARKRARAAP